MDMLLFFQTVIPSEGVKFLVEILPTGKKAHHPFLDFESMVSRANALTTEGRTIYHACASYKEIKYNEWGYAVGRTKNNVKLVKSLWQDFDVGKYEDDGTLKSISYVSKVEALAAIKHLMTEVGLPRPLLVSSGNGFHAYWPFTEAVSPEEWAQLTSLVRMVYEHVGIKFDSSRDMDVSSILRPVGSFNGGKEVAVLRDQEPKAYTYYLELFSRYATTHNIAVAAPKQTLVNEFAGAPREFPPSSMALVADRCAQIQFFRDSGGGNYSQWRGCIGIAKHTTDGQELAHEWGKQYGGYVHKETQEKLNGWGTGPTTCDYFRGADPERCNECAFSGKITSPIVLGYAQEEPAPKITVTAADGTAGTEEIPFWPRGFRVTPSGVLQLMIPDGDGVPQPVNVAAPLFYLKERIRGDDGTFLYKVRMNVKGVEWREFEMPAKNLAELRALKGVLASYEIVSYNDKLLEMYIKDYAVELRKNVDEINTFKQFGWTEDRTGFLIGSSLLHAGGRVEVRVSDEIIRDRDLLELGTVKGTQAEWTSAVDTLYNRKNAEPWQYAICTQFGAPLVELLNYKEWNGIPLAMTSGDSGYGKTTAVKIGMSAICDPTLSMISDASVKAILGRASIMNNLPFLVDEITKSLPDPIDLSDVLYSLSNGKTRIGMQSDGRERIPLPSFKLGSSMTGNKNLSSQAAESKTNPEAVQMRVFEIAMEDYPRMDSLTPDSVIHADHHELAMHLLNNTQGVFADDFFQFVINNRTMVEDKLHATATAIIRALKGGATKERYYAYHMACAMVGGWIAKKIGAIKFDLTIIKHWAFNHVLRMREIAKEHGEGVEDQFSHLLSEMHGSIIVTKHFDLLDTKGGKTEMPLLPIHGAVNARLVLGSDKERGKLFIAVKAVDDWCAKHAISPLQFRRQLAASGLLRTGGDQGKGFDKKVSIARGVPSNPMGRCRCLELDYAAAQGYIEEFVQTGNVVAISASLPLPATSAPASEKSAGT